MSNLEKYTQAFVSALGVDADKTSELKYQSVEAWDSVGHMGLMAELEDTFSIMLETEDIINFSSFEKGKEILKKYDIEL